MVFDGAPKRGSMRRGRLRGDGFGAKKEQIQHGSGMVLRVGTVVAMAVPHQRMLSATRKIMAKSLEFRILSF